MPCLIVIVMMGLPRLALLLAWALTDYTKAAFETTLWPILGFFFLPFTTICYMLAANATHHQISGGWIFLIVFGAFLDLGVSGSAKRRKRRRK